MGRVTASTTALRVVEVILLLAAELARILGSHQGDVVAKGVNAAGEVMGADAQASMLTRQGTHAASNAVHPLRR